ncbi:uncharacterized protein Z519_10512 [Cladophialophora bantiana CBS 173.52]|uniref:Uncharacterized protein n=1 Tax=Cladophialophora bantiana (strain ATCC 10958 / CBS 173.52 / CDC B-1940 / NIH 8579) TaxID=1442370 RepID=A0A0D2FR41_CLAB1|nr:uncharacterized protein Z519_10512 [Cladophialophora bantiana CBS 173.52]KIW89027.1 hypothetical protein Z519_10512 [Cladophialophora bantiana CBS 173.52]
MVFLVVFKTSLPCPLSYHWGQDIYEACPGCVHAHELRTCDGETRITFQMCRRHSDTAQSTALDEAVLNEIRTLIHPFYSPLPTFPIVTGTTTVKSREDLCKKVKITTATSGRRISSKGSELNLPRPEITYAHGNGCIYSQEPDVVLKPRAAVAVMDQYAKERLRNIVALLESGICCNLGAQLDTILNKDDQVCEGKDSSHFETAPNSGLDNCPATLLSEVAADESSRVALARHAFSAAANEAQALLRAEKQRLEECLATSPLAKGIYWKRCNGQWVNGLGDVLVDSGRVENEGAMVAGTEARGVMMDKEGVDERGSIGAASTLAQDCVDEGVADLSTLTWTSTPSLTMSTTAAKSISSLSLGSPNSSNTTPLKTTVCTGSLDVPNSADSKAGQYGYALLCHDDVSPGLGAQLSSSLFASQACLANSSSFEYVMLQNREQLVRSGQCREEDLCITCWAYNRAAVRAQVKKT